MTSSLLRMRSERPCSPSAQRSASARLRLARAVGPDDRADAGPELDEGALGEGLEALDPQPQQARRGTHDGSSASASADASAAISRPWPALGRAMPRGMPRARADRLERLGGRGRLGDPPRRPLTRAEDAAVDLDLDPEALLVVGPDGLDQPVERPVAGRALGVLLEPALGALERRQRRLGGQLELRPARRIQSPRGVPAEVEVDRADERLERGREERRARRDRRAGPRPRRAAGTSPSSSRPASRASPGVLTIAARRAERIPSSSVGVAPVERLGDGQADDGVPEELQALVVAPGGIRVLVEPAAVDEGLLEQVPVADRQAQSLRSAPRPGASARPVGSVRRRARRCSRRRPGRCGSSRRPRPRSPSRTPPRGS